MRWGTTTSRRARRSTPSKRTRIGPNKNSNTLMNESTQTDALRSDIDVTRRRMDDTMDQIGDRLQPRHLLDEILGMFRGDGGQDGPNRAQELGKKLSRSAGSVANTVVESIKENPMPALVIGAGIAWMI